VKIEAAVSSETSVSYYITAVSQPRRPRLEGRKDTFLQDCYMIVEGKE
jgi:hypothetical protein